MNIQNSIALVTGANRGIGRELVLALANAGAAKVYAAARNPQTVADLVAIDPARIVALRLDITSADHVAELTATAPDVTLLINNAGVLDFGSALEAPIEAVERNLAVNLYGPLRTTRALAPVIAANGGGGVVNLLSVVALASMPGLAAYNLSKAAQHSLTQSFRAGLRDQGVAVHGVYPGPVDTDMAAGIPFDKTSPGDVARAILEGVQAGREDIFPDAMSAQIEGVWFKDPKGLEQQFAAM
jgi:NAD(P)-dependent dehydrogenase (short-subunit alcohol dehydrogenase family)